MEKRKKKINYRFYFFLLLGLVAYYFIYGYMQGRYSPIYRFIEAAKKVEIGMSHENIGKILPSRKYKWKFVESEDQPDVLVVYLEKYGPQNETLLKEISGPVGSVTEFYKLSWALILQFDEEEKLKEKMWSHKTKNQF
jgi:hypothetical protein